MKHFPRIISSAAAEEELTASGGDEADVHAHERAQPRRGHQVASALHPALGLPAHEVEARRAAVQQLPATRLRRHLLALNGDRRGDGRHFRGDPARKP